MSATIEVTFSVVVPEDNRETRNKLDELAGMYEDQAAHAGFEGHVRRVCRLENVVSGEPRTPGRFF